MHAKLEESSVTPEHVVVVGGVIEDGICMKIWSPSTNGELAIKVNVYVAVSELVVEFEAKVILLNSFVVSIVTVIPDERVSIWKFELSSVVYVKELDVAVETGFVTPVIEKLSVFPAVKLALGNPFDTVMVLDEIEHDRPAS